MPYQLVDGKFVKNEDGRFINGASSKRTIWNALIEQIHRAEAAEARADAEKKERELLYPVIDEMKRVRAELEQRVKALESERDSAITDAVQDALKNIFNIAQEIANGKDGCGYCDDEAANKIVNIIDNRIAAIRAREVTK